LGTASAETTAGVSRVLGYAPDLQSSGNDSPDRTEHTHGAETDETDQNDLDGWGVVYSVSLAVMSEVCKDGFRPTAETPNLERG
jgi:hypothetical protein